MIALSERPHSGIRLDEIWVLDAVNHGDSALINAANLWDSRVFFHVLIRLYFR